MASTIISTMADKRIYLGEISSEIFNTRSGNSGFQTNLESWSWRTRILSKLIRCFSIEEMYDLWLARKKDQDMIDVEAKATCSEVTSLKLRLRSKLRRGKLQEATDDLSGIDLAKYIINYATIAESNLEKAYEMISDADPIIIILRSGFMLPSCSLKEEIDTVRCSFEKACQGIHKHSTYAFCVETLLDILDEANTFTVKLLQTVKEATDFIKQLSYNHKFFFKFFDRIINPIIRGIRDQIFKMNELMKTNSLNYDIISIIIALLLFICQSTLASATDMKQLMIFATVIHLIISGDVESNPGPQFAARDLLKKEPKTCDLLRIFVRSEAACHWKIIGMALEVEVDDLIVHPKETENNLGYVFKRWRQEYKDVTWETIIQVCEDHKYGRVRDTIWKFLSSREAHSKYGSKADFVCTDTDTDIVYRKNENGYSNKTVHGLLIILISIIIVLCSVIYQIWTNCKC